MYLFLSIRQLWRSIENRLNFQQIYITIHMKEIFREVKCFKIGSYLKIVNIYTEYRRKYSQTSLMRLIVMHDFKKVKLGLCMSRKISETLKVGT